VTRAFDHLVLAVDDLEEAARFYECLGFTLTPRAQHPFGTGNRLAQLQGCFLELLAVTEPENVPEAEPGHFNFGAYNRDFLRKRQGMSMMVLATTDAAADREDFKAAGLETYEMFEFSRIAQLPDGSEATVGFTLAFASVPELPEAVAFTCQQWRPDLFWKPEYQSHANSAVGISEVFLVSDDPGPPARLVTGLQADPVTARVKAMPPARFTERFPGTNAAAGLFAGYRIAVADIESARMCLEENQITYEDAAESLWVPPGAGFGCVIEFSERKELAA